MSEPLTKIIRQLADCAGQPESKTIISGLYAIANSIDRLATAINNIDQSITTSKAGDALDGLASLRERT